MGILHDIMYVVKIGDWPYKENLDFTEAERIVNLLSSSVTKIRIEAERRERG